MSFFRKKKAPEQPSKEVSTADEAEAISEDELEGDEEDLTDAEVEAQSPDESEEVQEDTEEEESDDEDEPTPLEKRMMAKQEAMKSLKKLTEGKPIVKEKVKEAKPEVKKVAPTPKKEGQPVEEDKPEEELEAVKEPEQKALTPAEFNTQVILAFEQLHSRLVALESTVFRLSSRVE